MGDVMNSQIDQTMNTLGVVFIISIITTLIYLLSKVKSNGISKEELAASSALSVVMHFISFLAVARLSEVSSGAIYVMSSLILMLMPFITYMMMRNEYIKGNKAGYYAKLVFAFIVEFGVSNTIAYYAAENHANSQMVANATGDTLIANAKIADQRNKQTLASARDEVAKKGVAPVWIDGKKATAMYAYTLKHGCSSFGGDGLIACQAYEKAANNLKTITIGNNDKAIELNNQMLAGVKVKAAGNSMSELAHTLLLSLVAFIFFGMLTGYTFELQERAGTLKLLRPRKP